MRSEIGVQKTQMKATNLLHSEEMKRMPVTNHLKEEARLHTTNTLCLNKQPNPSCSCVTYLKKTPYSKYSTTCAIRLEVTGWEGHRTSTNKFTGKKIIQTVVSNSRGHKSRIKNNCLHWTGIQSPTHLPRFYPLQNGNSSAVPA